MGKSDQLARLKRHYLFSALTNHQWRQLVPHLALRGLEPDSDLLLEASQGTFCILLEGKIKLYRITTQGERKIIRIVCPSQSFAESALFSDHPDVLMEARFLCASLVAFISRHAYLNLLRHSFETSQAVMTRMIESIYTYSDEIERLSLNSSHARVAHYLLKLRAGGGDNVIRLPSSKCSIARQLGLAPETLSRALRTLIDQHLINVTGSTVEITDSDALELIAYA